jgi:hypothetical protein
MKKINEPISHTMLISDYNGLPVRLYKNRCTDEISVNITDLAKLMGYTSAEALLSEDWVLDLLQKAKQTKGAWPLIKI